jgi:hypothetical protein
MTKTCTKCGCKKPMGGFHRNRTRRDGFTEVCKECAKQASRQWYQNNKERALETGKKWARNNREKSNTIKRAWMNRNPDRIKVYNKRWKARSPKNLLREKINEALRTAIRHGTLPPIKKRYCIVCGVRADDYHHHLGYDEKHWLDVVPVCRPCHQKIHKSHTI